MLPYLSYFSFHFLYISKALAFLTLLLYNIPDTLAEDSRLRRGGQLLGYRDIPTVSNLVLAWHRRGAYKI